MNRNTPECPFCGRFISRPDEIKTGFGSVLGGSCECGTIYVCDPTGHNTGEAYMEALALAKGNWQINVIEEDVDYETVNLDYDEKTHQVLYSKGHTSLSGRLVFIKAKVQQMDMKTSPPLKPPTSKGGELIMSPRPLGERERVRGISKAITQGSKGMTKERVRDLLELRAYDEVAALASKNKGVIRWLISFTYDKQDVISWKAIEAIGVISRTFSKEMMEVLRDTVRRLLWSMGEESGGIGWSAAEMLGEIVSGDPDAFNDIIPILWSFKEEEMFRAGIVWAMGRIAMFRPELVSFVLQDLPEMMEDRNPVVRGYTVRLMGLLPEALGTGNGRQQISKLLDDISPVPVYNEGELLTRTVAEIAGEVLHKASK